MVAHSTDFDLGVPDPNLHTSAAAAEVASEGGDRPPQALYVMVHQGSGFPLRGRSMGAVAITHNGVTVESSQQGSMSPLWNDVIRLPNCQINGIAQITVWHHMPPTPAGCRQKVKLGQTEILLTRSVLHGYTDDWVEVPLNSEQESRCKLRISFSTDKASLDQLKRGLRPEWGTRFRLVNCTGKDEMDKLWPGSPSRISIEKYAIPMLKKFS